MSDKTRLEYTVLPGSVYYTRDSKSASKVTLSIGASNITDEDIIIEGFQVEIPVSIDVKNTDALTADPSSIETVSLQPLTWDFQQVNDGVYRASPIDEGTVVPAGQSITFQLLSVTVNEAPGTAILTIRESSQDPQDPARKIFATTTKPVLKIKSKLDIISFAAVPDRVASGAASKMSWTTEGAARVTLAPGTYRKLEPNDSIDVFPDRTEGYTLTVYGEGPNVSKQQIIFINSPEIADFSVSATKVNAGDKVTLSWEVKYADAISIAPGDHKDLPAKSSLEVPVTTETTFLLTAANKGNEVVNRPVSVSINPVSINSFTATPSYGARVGDPIKLSWDVASAVAATVEYGTLTRVDQSKLSKGELTIVPNTGIAYSLMASNVLGSAMKSIELLPMPLGWYQFTANAPFKFPEPPLVLKYKNNMWAMASNLMNVVYYSLDGVNWIPATYNVPWQPRSYSAGVVFKDKMWLMGGKAAGGSSLSDVWSSTDGAAWNKETGAAQWSARHSFGCFVLPGVDKMFIVGGIDSAGNCLNDVWSSSDGKQWTQETGQAFQTGRAAFGTAVYNNMVWTVAGLINGDEQKGTPTNEVWYSANGAQWTKITKTLSWRERYYPAIAGLTTGLYLCGGIDENRKGINDLNKMNKDQNWSVLPGAPWSDVKVTSGLEYQDSLWCIGGGSQSNRVNAAAWAYSPALNS
jgi:hypothetical protein